MVHLPEVFGGFIQPPKDDSRARVSGEIPVRSKPERVEEALDLGRSLSGDFDRNFEKPLAFRNNQRIGIGGLPDIFCRSGGVEDIDVAARIDVNAQLHSGPDGTRRHVERAIDDFVGAFLRNDTDELPIVMDGKQRRIAVTDLRIGAAVAESLQKRVCEEGNVGVREFDEPPDLFRPDFRSHETSSSKFVREIPERLRTVEKSAVQPVGETNVGDVGVGFPVENRLAGTDPVGAAGFDAIDGLEEKFDWENCSKSVKKSVNSIAPGQEIDIADGEQLRALDFKHLVGVVQERHGGDARQAALQRLVGDRRRSGADIDFGEHERAARDADQMVEQRHIGEFLAFGEDSRGLRSSRLFPKSGIAGAGGRRRARLLRFRPFPRPRSVACDRVRRCRRRGL